MKNKVKVISSLATILIIFIFLINQSKAQGNDANTVLLINGQETGTWGNGSSFTESSTAGNSGNGHTITVSGDVDSPTEVQNQGDTQRPDAYFQDAIYFDGESSGVADYFSATDSNDWYFADNDFTIDCWIKFEDFQSAVNKIISWSDDSANTSWGISYQNSTNEFIFSYSPTGAKIDEVAVNFPKTINLNQWYHLAVERSSADVKLYLNGNQIGNTHNISTTSIADVNTALSIGAGRVAGAMSPSQSFKGYLDEIRISKGVARYNGNFTPSQNVYVYEDVNIKKSTTGSYTLLDDSLSSGGGYIASANYNLESTIGEPGAQTEALSANFYERSGFSNLEREPIFGFTVDQNLVNLGELTQNATRTGSVELQAMTDSQFGYNIIYTGETLKNGANDEITAMGATAGPSQVGISQFGLNLVSNTSPLVGSSPTGGVGQSLGQYSSSNNFAFSSGDIMAGSSTYSSWTTYTASFIANVSSVTPAGNYQTQITFIATGNF